MEISRIPNLDGLQSELEQLKLQVLEQEQRIPMKFNLEFSEKQILVQSELEIQKLKFEIEKSSTKWTDDRKSFARTKGTFGFAAKEI